MSTHTPPICYGRQYSDQDQECQRCSYVQACKPEFLSANGFSQPAVAQPPQIRPPSPYPYPQKPPQVPLAVPAQPAVARLPVLQAPQVPMPRAPTAYSAPLATQPQAIQPAIQQPQTQAVIPQAHNPYFQQYYQPYAGEQTAGRVATHVGLRMGYTLFSELAKFCEVWRPEPPGVG